RFRAPGFLSHYEELLFGTLLRVNLTDPNFLREITHFRLAIAGENHQALELMFRPQMPDKGTPFGTRGIAESKQRCKATIDYDGAFQATDDWWEMLGAGHLFSDDFVAARNSNLMTSDRSSQALPGRFTVARRVLERERFGARCGKESASMRMFRIQLETRHQSQRLFLSEARSNNLFRQLGLAVGKRSRLIENCRPATGNLL